MNSKIEKLINNRGDNYILPFFWQHGEDESTLREYMGVIYESNIRAVCVESRPHPDFGGPKWWQDMDVILDEARQRGMKVWILDDSHFPTGYANGALAEAPAELCRQSIVCRVLDFSGQSRINISKYILRHPRPLKKSKLERMFARFQPTQHRKFNDDRLLGVFASQLEGGSEVDFLDLTGHIRQGALEWDAPDGQWRVYILHLSRNYGPHRTYINMMDQASCRVLIDAVYEPHYARYKNDFGKTIAGFFSDEPELGNGHLFPTDNLLGTDQDLPWSRELEQALQTSMGQDYARLLPLLWENKADDGATARVRYVYMDAVTRLVEKNFSRQLGEWCSAHGVEYIGHIIEDHNQHARTSSSLGHYFRSLAGQHMAGIDVIGGQLEPQGEDVMAPNPFGIIPDRTFNHYVLAKLAASHAAIDPLKAGRAMCEIFGAFGWQEGVRLEKYLADHCMVRGINYFVPHAFSPKQFPDPDCPPHFYAGGHDPQIRHFGCLMAYMNRVCELINDGRHVATAAILYHGEAEWTGNYMLMQEPARRLAEHQIDFDILPQDVFLERELYHTVTGSELRVNTQEYRLLIVPAAQFITTAFARAANELRQAGFPVVFINHLPEEICDQADLAQARALLEQLQTCPVIPLDQLVGWVLEKNLQDISISPSDPWVRCLHYQYGDGGELYYLVNEGREIYRGSLHVQSTGSCYAYNAWDNRLEAIQAQPGSASSATQIGVELEPLKSLLVIFDPTLPAAVTTPAVKSEGEKTALNTGWMRSTCPGIVYPNFQEGKLLDLPDNLAQEQPKFSGFVRYENKIRIRSSAKANEKIVLEITDAHEGVEVFVNEKTCGIQIVPPFRFDISDFVKEGENELKIEVATTLERQVSAGSEPSFFAPSEPTSLSGITGMVNLYRQ